MKEIIKNEANITIVKVCVSCNFCMTAVAVDMACKYRACVLPGIKYQKVMPYSCCEKWMMAERFANMKLKKENFGQVKRKEYLDFVLWANTGDVPREIKAIVTAKNSIELLRSYWETQNKKSIYLHI